MHSNNKSQCSRPIAPQKTYDRKQSGSTLIISLVVLIVLMLLGVTAMTVSDTQYRLAGNLQFESFALNNAETAESTAEQWLETNAATTPSAGSYSLIDPFAMTWTSSDPVPPVAVSPNQSYVIGFVSRNASPLAGVGTDCYSPSNEHNFDCVNTYLITARGQSARGATKLVQSYYAVPLR